jgi:nudix-type nucleoside diphosphatase (YffH/AdpP family)
LTFRKVDERRTYDGSFVDVVVATFEGESGDRFDRELVRHGHAVAVVALTEDRRRVVLVRQFRPAIEELLLELPAGMMDVEGESAEATARRELEEEAGRRAVGPLEHLTEYWVAAGLMDEQMTIFLCRASETCEVRPQSAEEELMEIEEVDLDDVPAMIADGRIRDSKTIVGLLLARARL